MQLFKNIMRKYKQRSCANMYILTNRAIIFGKLRLLKRRFLHLWEGARNTSPAPQNVLGVVQ